MNFSQSVEFAFKRSNLPKILTITLLAVIIGSAIFVVSAALNTIWLALLIIPVLLGYSLFVQGYTISIIKHVMEGNESLPDVRLGGDIGRGAVVFLASIVYMLPMMILTAIFVAIIGGFTGYGADDPGFSIILLACGGGLAWLFMMFVLGFSLIVGQVRYAAENRVGALFGIGKNFGIVMSNLGTVFGLFFRQIGITMIFGILSSILLNSMSAFFAGTTNKAIYALEDANWQGLSDIAVPLAIFGSLYYTISLTINLMSAVSVAHLIAGFGANLGFATDKAKNGDTSDGKTAIVIIIAVVILLALVVLGTIVMLALMGPIVGDVFSEIILEMQ